MDIHPKSRWFNQDFVRETGGFFLPEDPVRRTVSDLEPWDLVRRDMIVLLLRSVIERNIPGELAELGVYQGKTARLIHHYLPERRLGLFDTFAGFDPRDLLAEERRTGVRKTPQEFSDTSLEAVLTFVRQQNDNVRPHPGFFPDSVPEDVAAGTFAFVHMDVDLYEPTAAGLRFFYPRLSPGGFLLVHDYNAWPGVRGAVRDFMVNKSEVPIPMPDKSGSALIVKR